MWWLGYERNGAMVSVFESQAKPTAVTHGKWYAAVAGPYPTREAALAVALRWYGGLTRITHEAGFVPLT